MASPICLCAYEEVPPPEDVQSKSNDEEGPNGPPGEAFVQAVDTLAVHMVRDPELQDGYFIGYHHLEDATAMFLYCAQEDTWAKEAVEPSDQRISIERATNKANIVTHANGMAGVRCKYDVSTSSASIYVSGIDLRLDPHEHLATTLGGLRSR
ncbi:Glutamine synthetase [Hordeum vulgare]|nr:Glutamine synthetase [Hordeum vulgare]